MARKTAQDFERQHTATDVDQTTGGVASTNTVSPINGASDVLINSLSSATQKAAGINMGTSNVAGPFYSQFWLKINTLPSAENTIAATRQGNAATGNMGGRLTIDGTGVIRLYNATTAQVGSDGPALSTGWIYRIEMLYDGSPAAGSQVLRARVDGVEFAGAANLTLTNATTRVLWLGGNINLEAQTVGSWQFDDVVIDDAAYPGGTKLATLLPDSAGDNNAWSVQVGGTAGSGNNFGRVNEVTPDNTTSYNGSNTNAQLDDYNLAAPPAAMQANATIPCVYVYNRGRGAGASANATYKMRIKASAGGTTAEGAARTPPSTTFTTNIGTNALNLSNFVNALDPDGNAWTYNKLVSTQIGMDLTASSTNEVDLTTVWLIVEYTNPAPNPYTFKPRIGKLRPAIFKPGIAR